MGSRLTTKIGVFPAWVWLAGIALVLAGLIALKVTDDSTSGQAVAEKACSNAATAVQDSDSGRLADAEATARNAVTLNEDWEPVLAAISRLRAGDSGAYGDLLRACP